MSGVKKILVDENGHDMRIDRFLRQLYPQLTQGRLQKLLRTGQVRVDGGRVKADTRLEISQEIRIPPGIGQNSAQPTQNENLSQDEVDYVRSMILHQDDDVLVLNKPSGLAVQGGSKTAEHLDRLMEGLRFGLDEKPRLVHRLDRDTSGVLLLARSRRIASELSESFRKRSARKIYWALVSGVPNPKQGTIDASVLKVMTKTGDRMRIVENNREGAQHAKTYYSVNDQAGSNVSWVTLKPVTGRTHQLRVHMSFLGHYILGDKKYGCRTDEESIKLHLHARRLTIPHPNGGEIDVTAPLPAHMLDSWNKYGFDAVSQ